MGEWHSEISEDEGLPLITPVNSGFGELNGRDSLEHIVEPRSVLGNAASPATSPMTGSLQHGTEEGVRGLGSEDQNSSPSCST